MKRINQVFFALISFGLVFSPALIQAADNVGYDKGLYIKTDDDKFQTKLNIQLQPQYQYISMEGQASDDTNINTFQIRRARFVFSGHAFVKNLTYKFQFEAVSGRVTTTREGVDTTGPNLREAFVNYKVNDYLQLRGGQFKPLYNREELTSSTALQFVDRSINNEAFTHGYDLGVMIHGAAFDNKFEYGFNITNENNSRNTFNLNNELLFGGRFAYNILGQHGYTMSDVKDSDEHQLVVGTAFSVNRPSASADETISAYSGDVAWRYNGWSFLGEGNFMRNHSDSTEAFGFLGQAGYFLIPEKFEVAGRFAGVVPMDANVVNGYEVGGSLNYFFKGHNVKIQTDYGMLINSPLVFNGRRGPNNIVVTGGAPGFTQDQTDHRIRTQLQLFF